MGEYSKVSGFFKRAHMHPGGIDVRLECGKFAAQMRDGLHHTGGSSLMMLPTYLSMDGEIPKNERVVAVDAGGTNFRVAVVHFNEKGEPVTEDFREYRMPGCDGRITMRDFYESAADYLQPVVRKSDKIGFCFSYPMEIQGNLDGLITREMTKEVDISDAKGKLVCDGINQVLASRGIAGKRFVVLNDASATMLSAKASTPGASFETYIGFIMGTGTNTCYIERTENIQKCAGTIAAGMKNMAVVLESGGYDGIAQGKADKALDGETHNPGKYMFEKMTSGAYLGRLAHKTVGLTCREGLFSDEFCDGFKEVGSLSLKNDVDAFCRHPFGGGKLAALTAGNDADRQTLYYIIDLLFERAAKIVACSLAGIVKHTGFGGDPTRPVCVCCDGSTFNKSKLYRSKTDYYIKDYIERQLQRHLEFIKVHNPSLLGAAIAALLN